MTFLAELGLLANTVGLTIMCGLLVGFISMLLYRRGYDDQEVVIWDGYLKHV